MISKEKKDLLEFLEILLKLTNDNIDFLKNKEIKNFVFYGKYSEEIKQIQNVINSFDFIGIKQND